MNHICRLVAALMIPCLLTDHTGMASEGFLGRSVCRRTVEVRFPGLRFTSQAVAPPDLSGLSSLFSRKRSLGGMVGKEPYWRRPGRYKPDQRILSAETLLRLEEIAVPDFPSDFLAAALESDQAITVQGVLSFMTM